MICVDAYAQADDIESLTEEEIANLSNDEIAIENLKKNKMVNYLLTQFNKRSQSDNVYVGARDDGFFVIDENRYAIIDEKFNLSLIGDGVSESTEKYLISSTEEWAFKKIDESNCAITAYLGDELSGVMVIPSIVIDKESGQAYNVTALGDDIFSSSYISEVDFSAVQNTLKSIGNRTFMRCTNLTIQVPEDLPSTVVKVGDNAFNGCKKLTGVIDSVIAKNYQLGQGAFSNCPGLTGSVQLVFNQNYPETADIEDIAALTEEQRTITPGLLKGLDGLTGPLVIPKYITKIGDEAFRNCKGITSLTFEGANEGTSNLVEIGSNAFSSCIGLKNIITFPSSLEKIGNQAFYCSWYIAGINLNEGLTFLGEKSFCTCIVLTNIKIPSTLENTGISAFSGDSALKTLTFNTNTVGGVLKGTTTIGEGCFRNCPLTSVELPTTLTKISDEAFYQLGTPNLALSIPDSVTEIGNNAFRLDNRLNIVHWPVGLSKIKSGAFYYNSSLTLLPDASNLEEIGGAAFQGCSLIKALGEEETDIIEWVRNASKLTYVGPNAFSSCPKLTGTINLSKTSVEIFGKTITVSSNSFSDTQVKRGGIFDLEGRTSIDNYEFSGWSVFYDGDGVTEKTDLYIPDEITTIGIGAFMDTSGFETISISKNLTNIGEKCFERCKFLSCAFRGTRLTSLANQCFYNCSVTTVNIPLEITTIGSACFAWCRSLKNVELPSNLLTIGGGAFENAGLTSIAIPSKVTSLGNSCFSNCSSLENISLPSSLGIVGNSCFSYCTALSSIEFPVSITTLPGQCFYGCTELKKVSFNNNITSYGNACFYNCGGLTTLENLAVSSKQLDWTVVTYVGEQTFRLCTAMRGSYVVNRGCSIAETATQQCDENLFSIHK